LTGCNASFMGFRVFTRPASEAYATMDLSSTFEDITMSSVNNADRHVVFFHCPNSRAGGVRILLEELGADYEMRVLSLKAAQQRAPDYLAVNPMGKVPAIVHGEAL